MRCLLALAVVLFAAQANAALLSLAGTSTTERAGHLILITSFANTNLPTGWHVRDGANAGSENPWTNYDWLDLGYYNATPGQPSTWKPASNIAVPIDGTQVVQLHGGGVTNLVPLHFWVHDFIVAGDTSVQLILPSNKPYEHLVFISPHLGTVVMTPEPAGLLLGCLGGVVPLLRRRA